MARNTFHALWRWSEGGALPIVIDASSCTYGAAREIRDDLDPSAAERHADLAILDGVEWCARLIERLEPRRSARVAIHPTCSTRHLGLARRLAGVAGELADDVVEPPSARCCGFAGDRGFLHPELTAAATAPEAGELAGLECDAYLCGNRTCEVGLGRATGRDWRSPAELLEELTRAGA